MCNKKFHNKHGVNVVGKLVTGSDAWWETIKGPQYEQVSDDFQVTFWWRDPAGNETTSPIQRVWIYITGVTDHHQNAVPQTLKRVPGTDAWQWQTTLSPAWRGSYCFIPSDRDDDFAPEIFNGGSPDRTLLREGWRRLLPRAIADPLNPQSWKGGRGHAVSALELPLAEVEAGGIGDLVSRVSGDVESVSEAAEHSLGAFLVAHLAYLKAYLSDCRRLALLPLILAVMLEHPHHDFGEVLYPVL